MKAPRFRVGMEIEQYVNDRIRAYTEDNLLGAPDGSGPWEFKIGPSSSMAWLRNRVFSVIPTIKSHRWVGERGSSGCGSHLHASFVPENEEYAEQWKILYNSLVHLTPLMAPVWAWCDNGRRYRSALRRWAVPTTRLETIDSMKDTLNTYRGRSYEWLTWNRNQKTALTIEMRANEAHPVVALSVWHRIIKWLTHEDTIVEFQLANDEPIRHVFAHLPNIDLATGRVELKSAPPPIETMEYANAMNFFKSFMSTMAEWNDAGVEDMATPIFNIFGKHYPGFHPAMISDRSMWSFLDKVPSWDSLEKKIKGRVVKQVFVVERMNEVVNRGIPRDDIIAQIIVLDSEGDSAVNYTHGAISESQARIYMVWNGEQLVGMATGHVRCSCTPGLIEHLVVHPTYRRQGIATAIYQRVVGEMQARDVDPHVYLRVDNLPSIAFHIRQGFQASGQREDHEGRETEMYTIPEENE